MKIIAITNFKGGVGKTTTARALVEGLSKTNKRNVLAIDLDGQANLTIAFGADPDAVGILEVLQGKASITEAIQHTDTVDILAACRHLDRITKLPEKNLLNALTAVRRKYDYVIIDSPHNFNIAFVATVIAADYIIIPITIGLYATNAITDITQSIKEVRKQYERPIDNLILGILPTQVKTNTNALKDTIVHLIKLSKSLKTTLLQPIPHSIVIQEAELRKEPILSQKPNATIEAYKTAIKQIKELMK